NRKFEVGRRESKCVRFALACWPVSPLGWESTCGLSRANRQTGKRETHKLGFHVIVPELSCYNDGLYNPQFAARVSEISPTVARARTASTMSGIKCAVADAGLDASRSAASARSTV